MLEFACDAHYRKGDELGWFEHGSTIIAIAPPGGSLHEDIAPGLRIRMGQPLFRVPRDLPCTLQRQPALSEYA